MRRAEPPGTTGPHLTDRQRKILQAIEDSKQVTGYPPTLREIAEAVGRASTSSVSYQLSVLAEKGYLSRGAGRPRTAVVRPVSDPGAEEHADGADGDAEGLTVARVPLVGRIAAGGPIFADQLIEDIIPLPRQLVGEGELMMLEVVGDSMIDAAITHGDWVVVRRESDVENGDIVAAMIKSDTSADGEEPSRRSRRPTGTFGWSRTTPSTPPFRATRPRSSAR